MDMVVHRSIEAARVEIRQHELRLLHSLCSTCGQRIDYGSSDDDHQLDDGVAQIFRPEELAEDRHICDSGNLTEDLRRAMVE